MSKKVDQSARRQAHRTASKRYWKEKATQFEGTGVFSEENTTRMKRGLAPRRLAKLVNQKTGETIEFHAPIELHHPFGLRDGIPWEEQTVVEFWPWEHAEYDECRHFPWDFVQWLGFK